MKPFERARSGEAKEIRRTVIIKAAAQIVSKEGFPSLTMDAVAKKSKLAKATLYGYFATREELLLTILQEDFATWFETFRTYLRQAKQPFSDSLVQIWIAGIKSQPRLATGLMYLHIQLEPNIGIEFAESWKRFLFEQVKDTHYEIISRFQPGIPLKLLGEFFASVTGVTIGLWAQSQSNEVINSVYKRVPELALLKTDFDSHMTVALNALLASPAYALLRKLERQRGEAN